MPIHNEKQRVNVTADDPISVTIDASDLSVASAEPLRNILSRYGRPVVARAFADFMQPSLADLAVQLYQMGFTLVHCPTWPNGEGVPKPVVGDVMAQDLRDQLEDLGEDVETYLLVATSRDYIAVANSLRRHDRRVVVVAEEAKVCRELRMCADEFAILPHSRSEREGSRAGRGTERVRAERPVEPVRVERPVEPVRIERPVEPVRVERPVEPVRVERPVEPVRVERAAEPVRAERPAEPQDSVRLPSDAEVLAEVRRIVAAEGICTPRRLARALCPVDRTATGELRSRIANRIQALVDAGTLQRERLVVGGTSVETILAREERNGRGERPPTPDATSPVAEIPAVPASSLAEPEATQLVEAADNGGMIRGEPISESPAETVSLEPEKGKDAAEENIEPTPPVLPVTDLDALVESVLRSPDFGAGLLGREPEPAAEAPEPPIEPTLPAQEPPKRTRSRRRSASKAAAVPEPNGTV